MMETQRKLHEASLLLKSAADDVEKKSSKLDPVYEEIATSMGLAHRAKRMLDARAAEE